MNMLETISKNPNVNNHNLSTFRIIKQISRARKMLFYTTLKKVAYWLKFLGIQSHISEACCFPYRNYQSRLGVQSHSSLSDKQLKTINLLHNPGKPQ